MNTNAHLVYMTRESHIGHANLSSRASLRIAARHLSGDFSEYTRATRSVSEIIHAQLTLAKELPANAERKRQNQCNRGSDT